MYRRWRTAGTVVAHPLAGLSAAGYCIAVQLSSHTTFLQKFNTDWLGISAWTPKSLLKWDINCLPPYMGLFSASYCWSCSSQTWQGMHLILMIQPLLFHWCQWLGKSPSLLIPLPTLRNISILLADMLPPNLWSDCCVTTCCFPLLRGWSSALSTAVTFPVTLCMAATFACFSFLVGAHRNGKAD